MKTPYFHIKQKTKATIVVHEEFPGHFMTYWAWKVLRALWFSVISPEFAGVDMSVIRHLEEAFKMMINHAGSSTDNPRRNGGGVNVDVEWIGTDNNLCTLRVFPKSDKYKVTIKRDELGNVMIDFPRVMFTNDIPGLNQARHICGQVVQVSTSMTKS
jgi:hypothetical protein